LQALHVEGSINPIQYIYRGGGLARDIGEPYFHDAQIPTLKINLKSIQCPSITGERERRRRRFY